MTNVSRQIAAAGLAGAAARSSLGFAASGRLVAAAKHDGRCEHKTAV